MTFAGRYRAGEHEAVWADIRALGPVPEHLIPDVDDVAGETMRRAARHVDRIVDALPGLGFVPIGATRQAPTATDLADLDVLAAEIGPLPAALRACFREVGGVCLLGDWPEAGLFYHGAGHPGRMPPGPGYPDPLDLAPASHLRMLWDEHRDDDEAQQQFSFDIAPDELHKANISGGTHEILLPDPLADPVLLHVTGRPGVTLVEYLRESVRWGGFPGWSFAPPGPAVLGRLRAEPDF